MDSSHWSAGMRLRALLALALLLALVGLTPVPAARAATAVVSDPASCADAGGVWDDRTHECTFYRSVSVDVGDVLETRVFVFFFDDVSVNGTLNLANGGLSTDPMINNGTINITGRGLRINRTTLTNDATIVIDSGGSLNNLGTVINNGVIILACDGSISGDPVIGNPVQRQDCSPPAISATVAGTQGASGWYVSDVTVSWSVDDDGSPVATQTGCDPSAVTSDTAGMTFTCAASSAGGSSSQSVTVKRDATAPTLAPTVSPNPIILGGSATVSSGAADALSGLASQSCGTLDTSSVGSKSVGCTASDNAGNSASATASYQVIYPWSGFLQPVDNLPTVNSVKAGSAVPVKFSLGGNYGLSIFAAGYPKVQTVNCSSGAPIDEIEQTVTASASGLSYDAASGQYGYTWKTDKSWAGSCRQLVLKLVDGSEHIANFQFR